MFVLRRDVFRGMTHALIFVVSLSWGLRKVFFGGERGVGVYAELAWHVMPVTWYEV